MNTSPEAKAALAWTHTARFLTTASQLDQLLHPSLDPKAPKEIIAKGLPASPGAVSGTVVFTADEAEAEAKVGKRVILVRIETSPEDIHGMHAAEGILTTRGGMTSHAAVVARGMGKPCVSGAGAIRVDVRDTGPGIAPGDQERIFERFRQAGDAQAEKPSGTGLGLAISREIIQRFGGRLWVESVPGRGATFSFTVPTVKGS